MQIEELREYQLEFEKIRGAVDSDFKNLFKLQKKFSRDYTVKAITSLALDDYVVGKQLHSFCYRIETELNDWGNMHGSPAKKFGVYYGVAGKDAEKKYRIGKKIFGSSIGEAFDKVKNSIVELIENEDNFDVLKRNPISPMFKGKILSIYHKDKFLNIFASSHLDYFINKLSLENDSKSELDKQNRLLEFKNDDSEMGQWSNFEFSKFLYHSFGKPNDQLETKNLSTGLKKYKLDDFPPIESVKFQFVDLQTDKPRESANRKERNPGKADYSARSKRFKTIGDRGEQIVVMAERQALKKMGRDDLARKVDQISKRDDSVGYDIRSYDRDGKEKFIEVKSTIKSAGLVDIFISANEHIKAINKENYYIYIVHEVGSKAPSIWPVKGADFLGDSNVIAKPIQYQIKLKTKSSG